MSDTPVPTDTAAQNAEIAELEGRMADTHAWGHDKAGQARIQQLYEAQETGEAAPAPPEEGTQVERKSEIESLMSDTQSAYYKGPESEAL